MSSDGDLMRSHWLVGQTEDEMGARRLEVDAYVQFLAASAVGKITGEEVEEGLHLDVEGLDFGRWRRSHCGAA